LYSSLYQGPKVQQKTKEQKLAAALAGARQKKKKWNKGKLREKLNAKVLFDEDGWNRLQAEVPKMKLITPSALVERLKINSSLARAACKLLAEEGKIAPVEIHHSQKIYTRVV
jgi:small subunit ribosomal protein S25e